MRRESRAHLLPPGAAAASAAGALRPAALAGEGTQDLLFWDFHLLPLRSAAGLGAAPARRAGREPGDHGAAGAAEVAASNSAGLEGIGPAAPGGNTERPGRAPPDGGGFSRGPARPPAGPGAASASLSLLPSQPVAPRPSTPPRGPGRALGAGRPVDVDALSAAPERQGCAGVLTMPGLQPGEPFIPLPELGWGLLRAGAPLRVRCPTDPFLHCAGRVELQPLLTLYSGFLERLSY